MLEFSGIKGEMKIRDKKIMNKVERRMEKLTLKKHGRKN